VKPPKLKHVSVKELRKHFSARVFAVPKLQREFVWDGKRAAALLDSISKGMPIGVVLIWQTKPQQYDLLRKSLNVLPEFDTDSPFGWFLIDGQQRLSVLHEAYSGGIRKNASGADVDFGRVCFVLNHDVEEEDHANFVYRKPVTREHVPIQDILSAHWWQHFKGYPKYLLKRIADCRNRILQYQVPILFVHSNDLEEVRSVFLRINSQGMTIGSADRAFARASKVDLRDLAHELRAGINNAFQDIEFTAILQGFAFVTEERELDVGQRALEATIAWWERKIDKDGTKSEFYGRWKKYRTAFGQAVAYLQSNFEVPHSGFLPSVNMLATLSVFFFHHPAAPSAKQRSEIRKWFWATGVGVRYSGRGYRQNLMGDVRFFRRLASSSAATFKFTDLVDPNDLSRQEYTKHSSLTNAFYCLLGCQKPRYLANGQPITPANYASLADRRDRHHIFPRQLLANHGFNHREYNSICNISFIAAIEHRRFGMKRPRYYLDEYRKKKHFPAAMRSHLIPYDRSSGLWATGVKKAYTQFRRRRLHELCHAFEKQAGIKLFRKS